MFTTLAPARAYPDARRMKWDPLTLAVAVLVVVVLGMVLLFMRAQFNPGAGGAPEESLPEFAAQPGECDLSIDHLLAGNSALESGDYESALAAFTCAIEADTTNYDARLGRIFAYLLSGQYARNVPDWVAITYGNAQVWSEAIARYSSAIEASPNDLLPYVQRSYVHWAILENEQAMADYNRILVLDPDSVYALLFRGNIYLSRREDEAADADFERARVLAPDNAHVYAMIGFFSGLAGHTESGLENLSQAIQLDPNMADFYISRGIVYEQVMEDIENAAADYSHAIELAPEEPSYYYWRGLLYRDQMVAFDEQAVADFTRAIELDPEWAAYYIDRALAYEQMSDAVSAAADLIRYIEQTQKVTIDQNIEIGETVSLPMMAGRVYRIPILARAGQRLTTRNNDQTEVSVDPIYVLLGADNTPLTASVNSAIRNYEIPTNGTYTLVVAHPGFGGQGHITLIVDLNG
jgi:tetratricopeptide (TPR) repeat protein